MKQLIQEHKLTMLVLLCTMLILVNGCGQGAANKIAAGEEKQRVLEYLTASVPEIQQLADRQKDSALIMEVQSQPDAAQTNRFLRDYYNVYVGFYIADGGAGHRSRWGTFLVGKGLDEILWVNPVDDQCISLAEWRNLAGQTGDAGDKATENDWMCIPFKRAGPLTAQTTEAELLDFFGRENVERRTMHGAEGEGAWDVSVVFADTPRQLIVFWRNNRFGDGISSVSIRRQGTPWKTVHGITVGTSLAELNRINGQPFKFYGFGWDYGGGLCLSSGGALTKVKGLHLLLQPAQQLPAEYYGEQKLDSADDRLLPDAVRVGRIDVDL